MREELRFARRVRLRLERARVARLLEQLVEILGGVRGLRDPETEREEQQADHDCASFGAGTGTISISGARDFFATATPSLKPWAYASSTTQPFCSASQ